MEEILVELSTIHMMLVMHAGLELRMLEEDLSRFEGSWALIKRMKDDTCDKKMTELGAFGLKKLKRDFTCGLQVKDPLKIKSGC